MIRARESWASCWYLLVRVVLKLGQGSAHQSSCRRQEDHETFQHTGSFEADLPRAEATETSEARECELPSGQLTHPLFVDVLNRWSVWATFSYHHLRICEFRSLYQWNLLCLTTMKSYFVTELLGTDLHRLLTSRPLEKQFIQYFLYQILVSYS